MSSIPALSCAIASSRIGTTSAIRAGGRGPDDEKATAPYHTIVVSRHEGAVVW
jgi:hypothetical protein